jgi:lipoprotein-releasing system permease protein
VEVQLDDPMRVDRVRDGLEEAAPKLLLTDWREMNRSLFAALTWQTRSLFLVLSLVVFVASFQVSSALVVLAIDKRRSTGMLMAIGATPARVRRLLMLAGGLLGGAGVVLGLAAGSLGAILLAVAAVCGLLVLGASWWPAWRSSRLDPVAALRAV